MGTKAYEEGFKSCLYSDYVNPYPEDSSEFDDYERGRTQKLKRSGSNSSFSGGFNPWEPELEPVRDVEFKPKKSSLEPQKPNPYAQGASSTLITKRLRRIPNAWHFRFDSTLVFTAQYFRFGGQRCSPLNAALG